MKHYLPPLPSELPDLPKDCSEIRATSKPTSENSLEPNLNRLPGLDQERFNRLSTVAISTGDKTDRKEAEQRVLGLTDLLRQDGNETIGLHPRVTHIVPLGTLDPLLEAVFELIDTDTSMSAYQYPAHLFECHGGLPDTETLYPPEYHVSTADIARSLRANDILTSVRRPGQSLPTEDELRAAVEDMSARGKRVEETITVFQRDGELEPALYIGGGGSNRDDSQSREQIKDHCIYLFHRHGLLLDIHDFGEEL